MWETWTGPESTSASVLQREKMVINIHSSSFGGSAGVRIGDYKLIRNPEAM